MRPLDLPLELDANPGKQEVLRAWIDGGMLSLSLSHNFPESYRTCADVWPMLLSDVFHHVTDALVIESGADRSIVQHDLRNAFEEVVRSDRGTRAGKLRLQPCLPLLPDPDVTDENGVEIIRIILTPGAIRVIVRVGMWIKGGEEEIWGNLLYDLCSMIASSLDKKAVDSIRDRFAKKILDYVEHPSTTYSGEFYGKEPEPGHSST
jgi:hypothetical protein